MPDPSVRPATEADIDAVVAMGQRAAAALLGTRGADVLLVRESPAPTAETVAGWIASADAMVTIGALDDVAVGTTAAVIETLPTTKLAVINLLWVDDDARAVGVGEALLGDAVDWARANGCDAIDAYALPGERITKNFFEAAGFKARLLTVHHKL